MVKKPDIVSLRFLRTLRWHIICGPWLKHCPKVRISKIHKQANVSSHWSNEAQKKSTCAITPSIGSLMWCNEVCAKKLSHSSTYKPLWQFTILLWCTIKVFCRKSLIWPIWPIRNKYAPNHMPVDTPGLPGFPTSQTIWKFTDGIHQVGNQVGNDHQLMPNKNQKNQSLQVMIPK